MRRRSRVCRSLILDPYILHTAHSYYYSLDPFHQEGGATDLAEDIAATCPAGQVRKTTCVNAPEQTLPLMPSPCAPEVVASLLCGEAGEAGQAPPRKRPLSAQGGRRLEWRGSA